MCGGVGCRCLWWRSGIEVLVTCLCVLFVFGCGQFNVVPGTPYWAVCESIALLLVLLCRGGGCGLLGGCGFVLFVIDHVAHGVEEFFHLLEHVIAGHVACVSLVIALLVALAFACDVEVNAGCCAKEAEQCVCDCG